MGGCIITDGHFHITSATEQWLLFAEMSLPREDTLGFAAGSSRLVVRQDDKEEALPEPFPELVGLSPTQSLAGETRAQGVCLLPWPALSVWSSVGALPGEWQLAVRCLLPRRICWGGEGRWVVLVLDTEQPAVTLLATQPWGWPSVCGVGLLGMATPRFISETCRAAWAGRGRRLSGGCCRLDLGSLKRSAPHCH